VRRPDPDDPSIEGVTAPENRLINHFFHDFKGGLSTVIMSMDALRDGIAGPVTEGQDRWLDKTERNCQNLVSLIDDFRDLTRMEDGSYAHEVEPVDPTAVFERLSTRVAEEAARRRIRTTFDLPDGLPGPRAASPLVPRLLDRLYAVLVDCTRTAGVLTTTVHIQGTGERPELVMTIESEGVECDATTLESVFDKFAQAGAGLQLGRGYTMLFCRAAARTIGGDLRLSPWPGHGTRVDLRLPLAAQ
jgi:K+-sensing histidine kinase KdpD